MKMVRILLNKFRRKIDSLMMSNKISRTIKKSKMIAIKKKKLIMSMTGAITLNIQREVGSLQDNSALIKEIGVESPRKG